MNSTVTIQPPAHFKGSDRLTVRVPGYSSVTGDLEFDWSPSPTQPKLVLNLTVGQFFNVTFVRGNGDFAALALVASHADRGVLVDGFGLKIEGVRYYHDHIDTELAEQRKDGAALIRPGW